MSPVGFVRRMSPDEDDRDRSLVVELVIDSELAPALDRIDEWSHLYVITWLDKALEKARTILHHRESKVGIFAARSPIHPNPIGLTLVELVKRERNVLWVRGLDAFDGTPVLDVKPYPDWQARRLQVVTDFRIPEWLTNILQSRQDGTGQLHE